MNYAVFRREKLPADGPIVADPCYSLLLSAYNDSDRVRAVFDRVEAERKVWILHGEYRYEAEDKPAEAPTTASEHQEGAFIRSVLEQVSWSPDDRLCVDITGMMRPHLLYLLAHLFHFGVESFDVLYSEPLRYSKDEKTGFSKGPVRFIGPVEGYAGSHSSVVSNDLLIVGSGYDHELISRICDHKENARKRVMYGLPALRPHMYQENVLKVAEARESIGGGEDAIRPAIFAPAYDPFTTADVLHRQVVAYRGLADVTNLYLAPLGTKAQALGFGLFYLAELSDTPASILFPSRVSYERRTGVGVSRVWRYVVELSAVRTLQERLSFTKVSGAP